MSTWTRALSDLRAWVGVQLEQLPMRLFGSTLLAKGSDNGEDAVEGADTDRDGQRPTARLEPFGLRGNPPKGLRVFWIRVGSSNVVQVAIYTNQKYGPTGLEPGETAVYSEQVEKGVHLTKDGDTKLAAAAGRTVQVAGDAYSLLKSEDLLADLKKALEVVLASNSGGPILNAATMATDWTAFLLKLVPPVGKSPYLSDNAKNG